MSDPVCPTSDRPLHGAFFFKVGDLVTIASAYLYSRHLNDWSEKYNLGLVVGHDHSYIWDNPPADEDEEGLVGVKVLHLTESDRYAAGETVSSVVAESLILVNR